MSQIFVMDLIVNIEEKNGGERIITMEEVKEFLEDYAKKWVFQEEKADGGFKHYQCRMSLKKKRRCGEIVGVIRDAGLFKNGFKILPTANVNKNDFTYVSKKDTRVNGPWAYNDEKARYIPRQIREIQELRPWQKWIVDGADIWDTRTINFLYCPGGNIGKSTLVGYCRAFGIGRVIPMCKNYLDIMRMVHGLPTSRMYMIDMPRAIKKENLGDFWSGIETVKDGYAYDDRYKFQEKVFDCPNIWVFSNTLPDMSAMSRDRWCLWRVDATQNLVRFNPFDEEVLEPAAKRQRT